MDKQPTFHVEKIEVPDPTIWPTDETKLVTRYALIDQNDWWWRNGHPFGVLRSMRYDRTSNDSRQYLRETEVDAWKDSTLWYTWEEKDGRFHQVFL